jgi:hypothetical protein
VLRVLWKRLHLKAYKLHIVQGVTESFEMFQEELSFIGAVINGKTNPRTDSNIQIEDVFSFCKSCDRVVQNVRLSRCLYGYGMRFLTLEKWYRCAWKVCLGKCFNPRWSKNCPNVSTQWISKRTYKNLNWDWPWLIWSNVPISRITINFYPSIYVSINFTVINLPTRFNV